MESINRQEVADIKVEGERRSDIDDIVKDAAGGMRGLRHAEGGPGLPAENAAEQPFHHSETETSHAEDLELDGMLVNLRGLA